MLRNALDDYVKASNGLFEKELPTRCEVLKIHHA